MSETVLASKSEDICRHLLKGHNGVIIREEIINNIRYADDTVIFAENLQDAQKL